MKIEITLDLDRKTAWVSELHAYLGEMRQHRNYSLDGKMSICEAMEEIDRLMTSLLLPQD